MQSAVNIRVSTLHLVRFPYRWLP